MTPRGFDMRPLNCMRNLDLRTSSEDSVVTHLFTEHNLVSGWSAPRRSIQRPAWSQEYKKRCKKDLSIDSALIALRQLNPYCTNSKCLLLTYTRIRNFFLQLLSSLPRRPCPTPIVEYMVLCLYLEKLVSLLNGTSIYNFVSGLETIRIF
jgi:hypothetical protein